MNPLHDPWNSNFQPRPVIGTSQRATVIAHIVAALFFTGSFILPPLVSNIDKNINLAKMEKSVSLDAQESLDKLIAKHPSYESYIQDPVWDSHEWKTFTDTHNELYIGIDNEELVFSRIALSAGSPLAPKTAIGIEALYGFLSGRQNCGEYEDTILPGPQFESEEISAKWAAISPQLISVAMYHICG